MKNTILFIFLFFSVDCIAQTHLHCGHTEASNKLFKSHPELKIKFEQREQLKKNSSHTTQSTGPYLIPVVFHILHTNGTENIDDTQVHDAIRILNRDFALQNPDTTAIIPSFKSLADSTGIQFALATIDPNGNCTNGIIRHFSADADWFDTSPTIYGYTWDPTRYMNVYVVRNITLSDGFNAAGYTYLPGTFSTGDPMDAIVLIHSYIGSIGTSTNYTSRALTHEVGHWFNLLHVFGWNSCGTDCNNDDYVNDTPTTPGYLDCPAASVPSGYQICTPGVDENYQNYMDYSYCNKMFTHDQGQRMRNALNDPTSGRNNLWTPANLSATGANTSGALCKADFKSNSTTNTVCEGNTLTFKDISWNGHANSWSWTFPGGTPASSTDSMPTIHYNTPGSYDVTLSVSNNSNSVTSTKTSFVIVNSSAAIINTNYYSESFEETNLDASHWHVRNPLPYGNTWEQTNTAAVNGSKSVMLQNTDSSKNAVDELISPPINMTQLTGTNTMLTFKVAYVQKSATSADKLQIYASSNCGLTWSLRKTIVGASLATSGIQNTSFTPNSSQWLKQSVNLIPYSSQTSLYVMFRFTSDAGNNIFIDDINIGDTTLAGIEQPHSKQLDFIVFPNPLDKNTAIKFYLSKKQKVDLQLQDINGKLITTIFKGTLQSGEHTYYIGDSANSLTSGTYIITLIVDEKRSNKKLVVK